MKLQPFAEYPACVKCLSSETELQLYGAGDEEYIEVTCNKCGHSWNMETADSKKKEKK